MPIVPITSVFLRAGGLIALAGVLAGCAEPAPTKPRTISASAGNCAQPGYPAEARRSEAAGTTTLEFEVSTEGKVTRVAVISTSGQTPEHKILDALALSTLAKCTFPPAPGFLPSSSRLEYVWRLSD